MTQYLGKILPKLDWYEYPLKDTKKNGFELDCSDLEWFIRMVESNPVSGLSLKYEHQEKREKKDKHEFACFPKSEGLKLDHDLCPKLTSKKDCIRFLHGQVLRVMKLPLDSKVDNSFVHVKVFFVLPGTKRILLRCRVLLHQTEAIKVNYERAWSDSNFSWDLSPQTKKELRNRTIGGDLLFAVYYIDKHTYHCRFIGQVRRFYTSF